MTETLARALQLGFVLAGAGPIGAVLMLAVARLTGAHWAPLARALPAMPAVPVLALGLLAGGAALPAHLATWQAAPFVAVRGVAAAAALAWAGARLAAGASATFAGVTLALYAWLVTPVATDWLMAGEPGHSVSAAGMMLFVQQIAAACAMALVAGWGGERLRGDLAKLLVAAALGLCYLAYMDYLVIWFGNLPGRVPFYAARGGPAGGAVVVVALLLGLVLPVALLVARPGEPGRRPAAASALAGLFVFDAWWIGGGPVAAVLASALPALLWRFWHVRGRREVARGG